MNYYVKAAFFIPVAALAIPVIANAEEVKLVDWKQTEDVIHLYNDVRTVTFSKSVDSTSLKDIQLWDKTAEKPVQVVATIDENDKQVKIKLADGTAYTNYHSYTLTIKNVKEKVTGTTIQPTNYHFKMVAAAPNEIPFASNYVVTNTSNTYSTFKLPAGASYIIYDQYGTHSTSEREGVELEKETIVSLGPNMRMSVSFLTSTNLEAQPGFSVEKTNDAAYTLYRVNKNTNIKIQGLDKASSPSIFFGSKNGETTISYAEYKNGNAERHFDYQVSTGNKFLSTTINGTNELIITNEGNEVTYVYAPKTMYNLSTIEVTDERAISALVLNRGEILQANSTEQAYQTHLDFDVAQGDWKISAVSYAQNNEVEHTIYNEQKAISIRTTGDTIIKNEIGLPLIVFGPGRYVTLEKTTEEPLTIIEVNYGVKYKVTSTMKDTHNVQISDPSKKGTYSHIGLQNDLVNSAAFTEDMINTNGNMSFNVSDSFTAFIENTGSLPFTLFGAKRATTFEQMTIPFVTTYTLLAGETVEVKSTPQTNVYLKEDTLKGSYTYKKNGYTQDVNFGGYPKVPWIRFDPNETITITNTSTQPITLFTQAGDVKFVKE